MLKPLDIVIAVSLATLEPNARETFAGIAELFETSPATTHRAVGRLVQSGLLRPSRRGSRTPASYRVDVQGLADVLTYGLRYFMPAQLGAPSQGMPTAHAAPDLSEKIRSETPYVWPCMEGQAYGPAIEPLHESVPRVARAHHAFYRVLALADASRVGRARERALAAKLLPGLLAEGVRT